MHRHKLKGPDSEEKEIKLLLEPVAYIDSGTFQLWWRGTISVENHKFVFSF